jgi:small subunit ribosomal protein S17
MMSTNSEKAVRLKQGVVIRNKMQKTVVVETTRQVRHPKYLKIVNRRVRYNAHDENGECQVGDMVTMEETRPLSKTKRWRVREIVRKAEGN